MHANKEDTCIAAGCALAQRICCERAQPLTVMCPDGAVSLTDTADFSGPPSTGVSGSVESAPKLAAPSAAYYSQKGTYGGHMFTTVN